MSKLDASDAIEGKNVMLCFSHAFVFLALLSSLCLSYQDA